MHNIWEEYNFLNLTIRNNKKTSYEFKSLNSDNLISKTINDAGGMQNRFLSGVNSKTHFIDAVSLFENYLSSLIAEVFLCYPSKITSPSMDGSKLFKVILKYDTKEEMLSHIIQEKIRSVFYGNPTDFFVNDSCKLEFKETFSSTYKHEIDLFSEITGLRNIIIHNQSRVDNKYIKENPTTSFKLKEKIIISGDYLRGTISLLIALAAKATECVVFNVLKGDIQGKLNEALNQFEKNRLNNWYDSLLKNS